MRRFSGIAAAIAVALSMGSAAWGGWQDQASRFDANRLAKLDEARAKGLSEAQAGRDIGLIRAVLDTEARPASAGALEGDWRCRTLKLGGMSPDIVYSWFRCRIGRRGDGLYFSKLNGTQRLNGVLYPHESGGYVLLGALSAKGEPPHRYSGNGPSAGARATPDDAVGLLESTGRSSARIEFPYPVQESTFDIIELKR
ncbi:MAG TPA: DUF4893 domain-containing protein [Rhizomicrobium sp.]|jgi:hypothetical protein|nr:DUF4893 domain-containing protein [Rhizomicrobium sp.]